jgi:hypothetical protein
MMKTITDFLKKLFSNDLSVSWTRIMGTIIIFDVLISWNIACLRSVTIQDVPWGAVTLVITAFTGKVIQTGMERINRTPLEDHDAHVEREENK